MKLLLIISAQVTHSHLTGQFAVPLAVFIQMSVRPYCKLDHRKIEWIKDKLPKQVS